MPDNRKSPSPTQIAAEGLRLQLSGFHKDYDAILQQPHCQVYAAGFCIGVARAIEHREKAEVDTMRSADGGMIWAFGDGDYDRGNRITIDANSTFMMMQAGQAEELRPVYELGVKEGQAFASEEHQPIWLRTFVSDSLKSH